MSAASAATGGRRKGTTKRDHMLEQMLESVDYTRSKAPPQVALAEDPMLPVVKTIALAADKRKAGSISAFRVSHMTEITTFMIVVEGNSRPQNQAIALAVEVCLLSPPLFLHSSRPVSSRPVSSRLVSPRVCVDPLLQSRWLGSSNSHGLSPPPSPPTPHPQEDVMVDYTLQPSKEGDAASGWILLDYGSVIVHIMTPQMRQFYKLEKRWKDAETVDVESMLPQPGQVKTLAGDDEFEARQQQSAQASDIDEEDPFWK